MRKRILIVDDELFVRELLCNLFSGSGYEVRAAANQSQALRLVETEEFQVAVVDIRLPGVTGLELFHQIRRLNADISLIAMSGQACLETAVEALRIGAHDFFLKPFRIAEIQRSVAEAAQSFWRRQEVRQLRERIVELETHIARLTRKPRNGKVNLGRTQSPASESISESAAPTPVNRVRESLTEITPNTTPIWAPNA